MGILQGSLGPRYGTGYGSMLLVDLPAPSSTMARVLSELLAVFFKEQSVVES